MRFFESMREEAQRLARMPATAESSSRQAPSCYRKNISTQTQEELVANYLRGESIRELAATYELTYNVTRNILLTRGVKLRGRDAPKKRKVKLAA